MVDIAHFILNDTSNSNDDNDQPMLIVKVDWWCSCSPPHPMMELLRLPPAGQAY